MLLFASSTLLAPVSFPGDKKKLMRAMERLALLGSGLSSDLLALLISFSCTGPWILTVVSRSGSANVIFLLRRRFSVVCFSCFRLLPSPAWVKNSLNHGH